MRTILAVLSCFAIWTSPSEVCGLSQATSNVHRSQDDHGNYKFGYNIEDGWGSSNGRWEVGDALGNKRGGYTITDADGRRRYVEYIADENGFRVVVNTNEPGTAVSKSGSVITKPVETADKHIDDSILQSLNRGNSERLDSEPLKAVVLDSPAVAHEHSFGIGSYLPQNHESDRHHIEPAPLGSHPADDNRPPHGAAELKRQHLEHHHHDVVPAPKVQLGSTASANSITTISSTAAPILVHANYGQSIVTSTRTNAHLLFAGSPSATHWKKKLYRQHLKKKYPGLLYSLDQTTLPRQITIEHPDPVDPKTLQSLLLSRTTPSLEAGTHTENYVRQYVKRDRSASPSLNTATGVLQPPLVKIVQPVPLLIHQATPFSDYMKSSGASAQHDNPIIELKTYRPHEGKAYPIHLKASESAGIPKYTKIIKRTGFGFRRYDEDEQANPVASTSDEIHLAKNHTQRSQQKPKLSSLERSENRKNAISNGTSKDIYSYY
ncbi:uncharacterized protein LOC111259517 isoform X1 [Varroa jacobsoni]|uniref:uncharacterized protein LOC111259517 isoform X1 n=1 Tax=Varroa jacobsoni TaxID=62625 RepID=UPI000BF4E05A|nr:uncharacterized protein LOC111259517 isoform X1 [Varroa jacobsoni]